jgi:hypothetical protein
MSIRPVLAFSVVIAALAWAHVVSAQSRSAAPARTNAPAPAIAEQADRLIKEMSTYVGSPNEFTFHADVTFDHVLPSGQKLQFSASEEVVLQRPGRLYVEWNGDLGGRQFWYDGKVTLDDPATPFYASEAAPPEMDNMLEQLVPKLDFAPRLANFLYRDPYKTVCGNIRYGLDLGSERCKWQDLPHPRLCREGHRLADLDRERPATHIVRAGDHVQNPPFTTAIHSGLQRLGFRTAHRQRGFYA